MKLFFQLNKVDVVKREVYGRATQEVPDKSGEIFDYDTSKPLFEAWSGDIAKATEGKSLGNIRAMHKPIAAGKVTQIDFNDAEKAIDICAKVVDDDEWKKVEEGVYTGFSIGGEYAKKWTDPNNSSLKRFTAKPNEISLVDNPCVPTAQFTMVKADGVTEQREFKAPAPVDPAPIADPIVDPAVEKTEAKPALAKSLYDVSELCSLISTLRYIAMSAESEKSWEQDDSPIPAQLRSWLADGAKILVAMAQEEVDELLASVQPPDVEIEVIALSAKTGDLSKVLLKAGARHSKSDLALVQKVHDHSVALGGSCGAEKDAAAGELQKAAGEQLQKIEQLEKSVTDLTSERDTLTKRVTDLEKMAAPAKGALRAPVVPVAKADDTKPIDAAADPFDGVDLKNPDAVAKAAMLAVHAGGARVVEDLKLPPHHSLRMQ